ncbi:hypothetical protein FACS1894166_12430 [Bacilli bacterium]|nr:hypothetical protein FACS1894166_12430 [Bacilli bacterium]
MGTATVCTAGISTVAVSVSNTNNSHTSSINTLTPTDRIINIQAMSAPTGGNQISSLNFGQTAYLVAQCSDDSAILGNFT